MKKRANGFYQKQVTMMINGEKKQKCFYAKTIAEMNRKIIAYHGEKERGALFGTIAQQWQEEHFKTLEYNTSKGYTASYKRAYQEFKDTPIKNITSRDINNFVLGFAKAGYAQKTVITQLQVIRQILAFAMLCGDLDHNVATNVTAPKNLLKTKRSTPSAEDVEKVKNGYNNTFGLFALFALYTGCRRGELLALQYKDIDFENKQITINKSVYHVNNKPFVKQPKTSSGVRTVALLEPLEVHMPKGKPNDYIFSCDGEIMKETKMASLWKKYCSETGLDITPHQLRHQYATRLYELGIDEKSAQDLLGHADIATTRNIYTHISEDKRKQTAVILTGF